jgi:DNA processing protein
VDAPAFLAWRGELPTDRTAVAIVGARQASGYGTGVAAWLAAAASNAQVTVVSGGALGIDAAAHEAALEGPGGTTVVLGCGHQVAYPRPHARGGGLFDRILDAGGALVSELLPWQPATPAHVRARNRVVAGLADAVVVVEGGGRSGALLTATAAAERGVPVLAVPGDVRAPGSVAPHRLLSEGAAPCTGPADVLEAVGGTTSVEQDVPGRVPCAVGPLPDDVTAVLVAAWPRPVRLDDLAARTGRSVGALLAATTRARVVGVLAEGPDGVRLRRAP